jgi:hypothetical protein
LQTRDACHVGGLHQVVNEEQMKRYALLPIVMAMAIPSNANFIETKFNK